MLQLLVTNKIIICCFYSCVAVKRMVHIPVCEKFLRKSWHFSRWARLRACRYLGYISLSLPHCKGWAGSGFRSKYLNLNCHCSINNVLWFFAVLQVLDVNVKSDLQLKILEINPFFNCKRTWVHSIFCTFLSRLSR